MDHSLYIHSPTEGHLCCFQVLAIKNKAAMNLHVQVVARTYHTVFIIYSLLYKGEGFEHLVSRS